MRIALVGDRDDTVLAHRAIEASLQLLRATHTDLAWTWPGTEAIARAGATLLHDVAGIWCVPASPYRSTEGALFAIRHARTNAIPFLGTCGGFQHALLEYARNVLGYTDAAHQEESPDAQLALLGKLACSLVEVEADIMLDPASRTADIVGTTTLREGFHCNYGLNPLHRQLFDGSALHIVGTDAAGDARVFELDGHPFFIGTLFQPERRALRTGSVHPIVAAFVAAAAAHAAITSGVLASDAARS